MDDFKTISADVGWQREDEKRAAGPKGQTYDFFRGRHLVDLKTILADVGWEG